MCLQSSPKIKTVDFDIYLPGTPDQPAAFIETIQVETYQNCGETMLTTASSELIERTRIRHMSVKDRPAHSQLGQKKKATKKAAKKSSKK
jgi:hypothetical protein